MCLCAIPIRHANHNEAIASTSRMLMVATERNYTRQLTNSGARCASYEIFCDNYRLRIDHKTEVNSMIRTHIANSRNDLYACRRPSSAEPHSTQGWLVIGPYDTHPHTHQTNATKPFEIVFLPQWSGWHNNSSSYFTNLLFIDRATQNFQVRVDAINYFPFDCRRFQ